jgi:hypothetical protein
MEDFKEIIMNDKVWIPTLLTGIAFGSMYYFGANANTIVSTVVGTLGGIIIGKSMAELKP